MSEEYTMEDIISKVAANSAELNELKKTFQQVSDYPNSMQIEYSDELKTKTFEKAPFLRFLESKGQVFDGKAALAGYFAETPGASDVAFIDELDDIPAAAAESISEVTDKMKTIVAPIEVSMMAQMGNWNLDLLQRYQDKKFIEVNNKTDEAILEGYGTAAKKDFKGITRSITTHTQDMDGDPITEAAIDDMLEAIHNDGGNPDCIVCSYGVAKQLKAIVAPYRRYNDKIDIGLGHRVTSYESMFGTDIPILVDGNFDTTGGDKLAIVDSSTIEVRRLMPPTLITDLPVNKLAYKNVIAAFLTTQNIGEFQNALITGIGDGE
jgi:hypothetical protein